MSDADPVSYRGGRATRSPESTVRVEFKSLARGELMRYLEPGEGINLPADRVEVLALDPDAYDPDGDHGDEPDDEPDDEADSETGDGSD